MTYTEIKQKNEKRYFYRVKSIREGKKFKKERIYLGKGLSKADLSLNEKKADLSLNEKKRQEVLNKLIPKIRKILKKNNVKKAGIFGSYAKGEQKKNSDIDILIEPPKGIGFGFVGIQFELEDKLKKKVDLITYKYISPYLKENILKSEVRII